MSAGLWWCALFARPTSERARGGANGSDPRPTELQMEFAGGANGSEPGPMELLMESRPTSERARGGVNAPLERHEIRWRIKLNLHARRVQVNLQRLAVPDLWVLSAPADLRPQLRRAGAHAVAWPARHGHLAEVHGCQ